MKPGSKTLTVRGILDHLGVLLFNLIIIGLSSMEAASATFTSIWLVNYEVEIEYASIFSGCKGDGERSCISFMK